MSVSRVLNNSKKHINVHLLWVYTGVWFYTLSKHITIMDLSFQESLGRLPSILNLIGCGILLISTFLFDRIIKKKTLIVSLCILAVVSVNLLPTGYRELLYIFIVIYSIRNVNIDAVVKFMYINIAIMTIMTIVLVKCGLINDFVSIQTKRMRHCLGFSSWTVLPFQYMALVLGYTLFAVKPIKIWKIILLEVINCIIYELSDTDTAFGLTTVYLIAFILFYNRSTFRRMGKRYYLCAFPWIMAAFSFILDYLYSFNTIFMQRLNIILNDRLSLNHRAYEKYGIHILSSEVKWVGIEDVWNYFVVDNSYVNNLITFGVSGLILILVVYTLLIKLCIDKRKHLLVFIICLDLIKNLLFNRLLSYQQTIYIFYIAELLTYRMTTIKTNRRLSYESTNS